MERMELNRGGLGITNQQDLAREKVGCVNWGLVTGKTNTIYQWQDLNPVKGFIDLQVGPEVWFHDLFCADGTPYNRTEIEIFKEYTGVRRLSSSGATLPELAPN